MAYREINLSIRLLRLTLGVFFIAMGFAGLFPNIQESVFSLNSNYSWLEVIFGVAELICGVLLLVGFFTFNYPQPVFWGGMIALILWGIRIALTKFAWGFTFISSYGVISVPDFFNWLIVLLAEVVIGIALFAIMSKNS